jgi:hypothetical protein
MPACRSTGWRSTVTRAHSPTRLYVSPKALISVMERHAGLSNHCYVDERVIEDIRLFLESSG